MAEGEFPYEFPFTFPDFLDRFIKFTDIDDGLIFFDIPYGLDFSDVDDGLIFTEVIYDS